MKPSDPTSPMADLLDPARLRVLRQVGLLDTPPEEGFDRLTELATQLLGVPVSLVSLVDRDRQFFKSVCGLDDVRETPLSHSFCRHTVETSAPLVVEDARRHSLVSDNLAIEDLGVVAYLGIPLETPDGHVLGSFCVIDHEPRTWSEDDVRKVETLARMVMTEISLRLKVAAYEAKERELARANAELGRLNGELEERVEARTRALKRSNEVLAVRNRELRDFTYIASHDLQEPLRKIQIFSGLLHDGDGKGLGDEERFFVERIRDGAVHMAHLINDLLTYSRVATERQPYRWLDLGDVLDDVEDALYDEIEEAGARVVVDPMPTLHADALQMYQLVRNLVGNAVKFRRPGVPPVVQVRAAVEGTEADGRVTLTVEDNGIGFDAKYRDRIFGPFQRLHQRGAYPGTGMGLAICKRIVERHRGEIVAHGTPGVGSRFVVTLPRVQKGEENSA